MRIEIADFCMRSGSYGYFVSIHMKVLWPLLVLLHVIAFVACGFACICMRACNIPMLKHSGRQVKYLLLQGFVLTFPLWFSRVASDLVLN